MHTFCLILSFIGILATLYAFIGSLLAARNKLPVDSLPMQIYRWSYRSGVIVAIIGMFLFLLL